MNYPFPATIAVKLVWAGLMGKKRSIAAEGRAAARLLRPPLRIEGRPHAPRQGPGLVTINHYSSPGFAAWWQVLAVNAAIPADIHWIMTAAYTFGGDPRLQALVPLTRWAFRRVAQVYDFTLMPAMPPAPLPLDPADSPARAGAVRRVLSFVKNHPTALIGLAPEGRDQPGGELGQPPENVGRFILLLARRSLPVYPVAVLEYQGALTVRFGPAYSIDPALPPGLVLERVMGEIRALLEAGEIC